MKKDRKWMDLHLVLTLLRAAGWAAGALGTLLAAWFGLVGWSVYTQGEMGSWASAAAVNACAAVGFGVLAGVSLCCLGALAAFDRLCVRLRAGRAFCEENERAMARIAGLTAACGAQLLFAVAFFELVLLDGEFVPPVWLLTLFMLAFFGVALLSWALSLLVRRAAELQRENDLTV